MIRITGLVELRSQELFEAVLSHPARSRQVGGIDERRPLRIVFGTETEQHFHHVLPRRSLGFGVEQAEIYGCVRLVVGRSDEHTSELQSLLRLSYAVFSLNKKIITRLVLYSI